MAKYEAVIFDLDGVLCHTDKYHYEAWKSLADELNIPFDEEKNNLLRGVSRKDSLDILLGEHKDRFTAQRKRALCEQKNQHYQQRLRQMTPKDIPAEALRTLEFLKNRGVKLAIGSSSKNAPIILRQTGLSAFFSAVADGNHVARSKPDPEVFILAAKLLSMDPSGCLVVEDAVSGVKAAKAGGFDVAGVGAAASCELCDFPLQGLEAMTSLFD